MKFPNASQGVKKLFTSEILNIIAGFLLFIGAIGAAIAAVGAMSAANQDSLTDGQAAALLGGGAITAVFMFGGLVISIIAYIMMIVGLNNARKDDSNFNTAFIFVFVSLILSVISSFIPGVFGQILSSISQLATMFITVYIILGIRSLAIQLGNQQVENKGKTILYIIAVVYILAFIAKLVSTFTTASAAVVSGVLAVIVIVLDIIAYIIFLTYLAQAKKMLAQ